jgi:hypothetical protein
MRQGDINEHEGLVAAIKQADVVFSAVGHSSREEVEGQLKIVAAIQEAGGVKVYIRKIIVSSELRIILTAYVVVSLTFVR